jgi:hypothetical protein
MADAGFAAQDVGAFRCTDRGHSAEKAGWSLEHGATERPAKSFVGCLVLGMMALERFEGGRVPSATASLVGAIHQRARLSENLLDEAKANPCEFAAARAG